MVLPALQLGLDDFELRCHPLRRRNSPDIEGSAAPEVPTEMREPQKRERLRPLTFFRYPSLQPFLDQPKYSSVGHSVLDKLHGPLMAHVVEETTNVRIEHPVHSFPENAHIQRVQRLMRVTSRPESVRKAF